MLLKMSSTKRRATRKFAFETLRGKINELNDQFRNFLLPLLGDKDQEKVLDVVAKFEKNNRRRQVRQYPGAERQAGHSLIVGFVASIVTALAMSKCIVKTENRYDRNIWLFS